MGSRALANCFAMGLCKRPWKSNPASKPRDLTAFSRSTQESSTEGESSQFTLSVAFILMHLRPCEIRSFLGCIISQMKLDGLKTYAAISMSFGRSPPIHA